MWVAKSLIFVVMFIPSYLLGRAVADSQMDGVLNLRI